MPLNEKDKKTILDFFELLFRINERNTTKEDPNPQAEEKGRGRFIPLSDWNKYHDYPRVSQLRAFRFNGHKNGFDKCIRRVGKRIYISEDAFFEWMDQQK